MGEWNIEILQIRFCEILDCAVFYRGAGKSLALQGRKEARKHIRDARDFNKIET